MTDSKPRKTLTLAKKTAPTADDSGKPVERRQRSGARARQVAQRGFDNEKDTAAPPAAPARSTPQEAARNPRHERRPGAQKDRAAADQRRTPAVQREERPSRNTRDPLVRQETVERPRPVIERRPRAHLKPRPRDTETFDIFAPCPRGLEDALHAELDALGYADVRRDRAGCHFRADWTGVLKANLYSRLATRIMVQVAHAPVRTEDDILALAHDTAWERWFGPDDSLRVDTSAVRSPMRSLQYCNLRVKDGICDRLREREGARPDIDTVRPDARVHLFLTEDTATLYVDTTGESLFKRGWRLDKGEAPLRENLAAGLIALAGWDPAAPLMDPFCGSGTILIEAAWIALGVPPGIWRPFGFERLRDHNERHWRDLKDDARSRIATRLDAPIIGYDIDSGAIEAARANQQRAMLSPDTIQFAVGDARHVKPTTEPGWVITNPPYGERMEHDADFWPAWAENLKHHYAGWKLNVITSDLELPSRMRLKAHRRHPVYNGALDCRLFAFDMVEREYRR